MGFEDMYYKINALIDEHNVLIDAHNALIKRVAVLEGLPNNKVETVICPCGYRDECSIHCGLGHDNGQCTPWPTSE